MDVNVAFPGVEIVVFHTVQPQDTGGDQIIGCRPIRRGRYWDTSSEDGVVWVFSPDFLVNLESSRRSAKASLCFAEPKSGGGDRKATDHSVCFYQVKNLFFGLNPDLASAHFARFLEKEFDTRYQLLIPVAQRILAG
jgi:hypothetical protein